MKKRAIVYSFLGAEVIFAAVGVLANVGFADVVAVAIAVGLVVYCHNKIYSVRMDRLRAKAAVLTPEVLTTLKKPA